MGLSKNIHHGQEGGGGGGRGGTAHAGKTEAAARGEGRARTKLAAGHTRARARTLFAQVLDCPGGGLRIDTIHAFAQWLLAAFPHEAGLTPGTKAMEDRDRDLLAREVLSDLLLDAERSNDAAALATLERAGRL